MGAWMELLGLHGRYIKTARTLGMHAQDSKSTDGYCGSAAVRLT